MTSVTEYGDHPPEINAFIFPLFAPHPGSIFVISEIDRALVGDSIVTSTRWGQPAGVVTSIEYVPAARFCASNAASSTGALLFIKYKYSGNAPDSTSSFPLVSPKQTTGLVLKTTFGIS